MASRADLSELCRKANLAVSGTKQDMLDRLLGDESVRTAIMSASKSSGKCTSGKCDVSKGIKKKASKAAVKSQSRHSGADFAKFFNEKQGALVRAGVHGADEVRTLIESMWDKKLTTEGVATAASPAISLVPAVPAVVPEVTTTPVAAPNNICFVPTRIPDDTASVLKYTYLGPMAKDGTMQHAYLTAAASTTPPQVSVSPPISPSIMALNESTLKASLMALGLTITGSVDELRARLARAMSDGI